MRTSPFFVPQKEINLIDSMNEELIDDIIGQAVDIYKVSLADMSSLIADFSNLINTKEGHDGSNEGDNMDPLEMSWVELR